MAKRVSDDQEDRTVDTSEFDTLDLKDMLAITLEGLSIKDQLIGYFNDFQNLH